MVVVIISIFYLGGEENQQENARIPTSSFLLISFILIFLLQSLRAHNSVIMRDNEILQETFSTENLMSNIFCPNTFFPKIDICKDLYRKLNFRKYSSISVM